jgi:hypothetical protein
MNFMKRAPRRLEIEPEDARFDFSLESVFKTFETGNTASLLFENPARGVEFGSVDIFSRSRRRGWLEREEKRRSGL